MREDIGINIECGDIFYLENKVSRTNNGKFDWVSNPDGLSRYIYGEVTIPDNITEKNVRENGIIVNIPYTPIDKEFQICLKKQNSDGSSYYITNSQNGSKWFLAKSCLYGGDEKILTAPELILISAIKEYCLKFKDSTALVYDAQIRDFNIIDANRQNANLLLQCIPSNFYRYPISGIGLKRWLNSNINYTRLSEIIKREMQEDGVVAKNISYDFTTKKLYMDLNHI